MLEDGDNYARHQAVLMLQEAGVVDRSVDLLAGPEGAKRRKAETLLRRIVNAGQTARLIELTREHPDAKVRQALKSLLPVPPEQTGEGA